jgi:hypothetical protein
VVVYNRIHNETLDELFSSRLLGFALAGKKQEGLGSGTRGKLKIASHVFLTYNNQYKIETLWHSNFFSTQQKACKNKQQPYRDSFACVKKSTLLT